MAINFNIKKMDKFILKHKTSKFAKEKNIKIAYIYLMCFSYNSFPEEKSRPRSLYYELYQTLK